VILGVCAGWGAWRASSEAWRSGVACVTPALTGARAGKANQGPAAEAVAGRGAGCSAGVDIPSRTGAPLRRSVLQDGAERGREGEREGKRRESASRGGDATVADA
jgi:hypothetical protein